MKSKRDYLVGDKVVITKNLIGSDVPSKGWQGVVQYNHIDRKYQNLVILIECGSHHLLWHVSYSNVKPL